MSAAIDHLVVAADSLEQGAAWCESTLGVAPGPGGKHLGMGTHNRLLAIGTPAFPKAYLEIIAIDPEAPPPARPRWFGLDDPLLRDALRRRARLLHVVARTTALDAALEALAAQGVDAGRPVAAERASAHGLLRWRIAGRADGTLLFGGALPTLIEWSGAHPSEHMAPSGVGLAAVTLGGLPPAVAAALDLHGVVLQPEAPALCVEFHTPRGRVRLCSED